MNMHAIRSFLVCGALLAGCSTAPYAARAIENDAETESSVVVADASLHDVVRAGKSRLERIQGTNQLRVIVPVRNVDDEDLHVTMQVSFYDRDRAPIGDDSSREQKIIAPGHTINYVATSRMDNAEDFVLRVGWAK